jgi:hypothetical protein
MNLEKFVKDRWSNKVGKFHIVEVMWRDAVSLFYQEWGDFEDAVKSKPSQTLSVGYLVKITDEYLILASICNEVHVGNGITIPMGMVEDVRYLT